MKRKLLYLALVTTLVVGCQSTSWKTFSSEEGGFSVSLPGSPTQDSQAVNTAIGPITMYTFMVELSESAFMVAYSDYPDSLVNQTPADLLLSGARDGAVANVQGRLVNETSLSLQGHPGRELLVETADAEAFARVRIFLAGNRMYQVMALTTTQQESQTEEVTNYLNSFHLLE